MIKTVIAYDDNDAALGDYFAESYNNLRQAIDQANVIPSAVLCGLECDEQNILSAIKGINHNPFVFIGLSHGNATGELLLTNNNTYVDCDNVAHFRNSFVYTTACNAALILRQKLLENGCSVFIGYNKNSKAPFTEAYNTMFIDCELFAVKKFFSSDNTIAELFDEMINYTQEQIDVLTENNDIIDAMDLEDNMVGMIIDGNKMLRRRNFILP